MWPRVTVPRYEMGAALAIRPLAWLGRQTRLSCPDEVRRQAGVLRLDHARTPLGPSRCRWPMPGHAVAPMRSGSCRSRLRHALPLLTPCPCSRPAPLTSCSPDAPPPLGRRGDIGSRGGRRISVCHVRKSCKPEQPPTHSLGRRAQWLPPLEAAARAVVRPRRPIRISPRILGLGTGPVRRHHVTPLAARHSDWAWRPPRHEGWGL